MRIWLFKLVSVTKSHVTYPFLRLFTVKEVLKESNLSYGPHQKHRLDVYSSGKGAKAKRPIAVVIHGGGWATGDKRDKVLFSAALARRGYVVFCINYRLAPQHRYPAAVEDCLQALSWIRQQAKKWGADSDRITIIGDSAGAHLACLSVVALAGKCLPGAADPESLKSIQQMILYYGVYNLQRVSEARGPHTRAYMDAFFGDVDLAELKAASPICYASLLPRSLLIASEVDPLHMHTNWLARALRGAGRPHQVLFLGKQKYPHARHGFQSLHWSKAARAALAAMQHLAKEP